MGNIKTRLLALCVLTLLFGSLSVALGDWQPGDDYKMHFPQLPDPNGWDVEILTIPIADDWQCTQTGPVKDIHFWTSWAGDNVGQIEWLEVSIHANIPDPNPGDPCTYSQPGAVLWSRTFTMAEFSVVSPYGIGDQGFYDPPPSESWGLHDHVQYQQINIEDISDPFIQQAGNIYWLSISAWWEGSQSPVGWKTSQDHFQDVAVYWDYFKVAWIPLYDPNSGGPLDLAFVITRTVRVVPTASEWGLIVLAGVLLTAGAIVIIRRRRVAA
jgi:hypothetical protein